MGANDILELTPLLKGILWVELIVYMGIGLFEILDSFREEKPWVKRNGKLNSYLVMKETVGYKMHASVCFLLGFVALNGILEGAVTRFELELIFVSLALIMMLLWITLMPGRLGLTVVFLTKPETTLQILMLIFFWDLIRPGVLLLCLSLNVWGFVVYFLHTRKKALHPYAYKTMRDDAEEAGLDEKTLGMFDKLAGK
jgi:hypothetical protein|tara:strand:+ start:578 stop:1171 length:594 start_codon:yes stop_codon:yes gene_type:complete